MEHKEVEGQIKPRGHVRVQHIRANEVIGEFEKDNVTCNAGVTQIASLLLGQTTFSPAFGYNWFNYCAIGTGTTAATIAATTLTAEVARQSFGNPTVVTTSTPNDTAQGIATFAFLTTSYVIAEVGIFDTYVANSGHMLGYIIFPSSFSVVPGDYLQVTWSEQF